MTVKELMEVLSGMPEDAPISLYIYNDERGENSAYANYAIEVKDSVCIGYEEED